MPRLPMLSARAVVEKLLRNPTVIECCELFEQMEQELIEAQVALCQIPAPPLQEQARGNYFRQCLERTGLATTQDRCGNVIAVLPAKANDYVCVSAHLDTAITASSEVRIEGSRYYGCGISDNCAGLVGLLALAQALARSRVKTRRPILFVATVGEEGVGDLRGSRYLFQESSYAGRIFCSISLDGPGLEQIVNTAIGVRRLQATITGSGGHSWSDYVPNPVHAAGRAIAVLADYKLPAQSTLNIGSIGGGGSINSIPTQAWIEADLRFVFPSSLEVLEKCFREAVFSAVELENRSRPGDKRLKVEISVTGNRPSGSLPESVLMVQLAIEATRAVGAIPILTAASTDSNIPLSLGIEALTLGAGGDGGAFHTAQEWYNPEGRSIALRRALLLTLALTGVQRGRCDE